MNSFLTECERMKPLFENLYYLSAFFGIIIALFQLSSANKTKRIEIIESVLKQLRFDKDISKIINTIDYREFRYDGHFHGSKIEFQVDKLLSYLDFICYLKFKKFLSKAEFSLIKYEIMRICSDRGIQRYLWNIYHFGKTESRESTFYYLIRFVLKHAKGVALDL